jgi:hypothetical protein
MAVCRCPTELIVSVHMFFVNLIVLKTGTPTTSALILRSRHDHTTRSLRTSTSRQLRVRLWNAADERTTACWARGRVSRRQGGRETWNPASSEHRRAARWPRRTLERSLAGTSGTRSERTRAATTTSEDLRCAARRRPLAGGGLGRCLSRQAVHEATCTRVQRAGEDSTSRRERALVKL